MYGAGKFQGYLYDQPTHIYPMDVGHREKTKPKNQLARAIRVLIRQIYIKIKIKMQTGDYGAGFAILVPVRDGIIRWSNPWNSSDLGM